MSSSVSNILKLHKNDLHLVKTSISTLLDGLSLIHRRTTLWHFKLGLSDIYVRFSREVPDPIFLLGAGASVTSGIPLARELAEKNCYMGLPH